MWQIVGSNADEVQKSYGRHFDVEDELVSTISRKSIDLLKENYRVCSMLLIGGLSLRFPDAGPPPDVQAAAGA